MKTYILLFSFLFLGFLSGCATSERQVLQYERDGNIPKLAEIAQSPGARPRIRRLSLQSLGRLDWQPRNEERLQIYKLANPPASDLAAARAAMAGVSAGALSALDKDVVSCARLLNARTGEWHNYGEARRLYDKIRVSNSRIVTVSLCQQLLGNPQQQTQLLLLSIKLGLRESEASLNALLLVYGDKAMAEDYLNSGSSSLYEGARRWAAARGYNIATGAGSHRAGWGRF